MLGCQVNLSWEGGLRAEFEGWIWARKMKKKGMSPWVVEGELRPETFSGHSSYRTGLSDPTTCRGRIVATHMRGKTGERDCQTQQCQQPPVGQTLNSSPWLPGKKLGPSFNTCIALTRKVLPQIVWFFFYSREEGNMDFYAKSHYLEMLVTKLKNLKNSLWAKENTRTWWSQHKRAFV